MPGKLAVMCLCEKCRLFLFLLFSVGFLNCRGIDLCFSLLQSLPIVRRNIVPKYEHLLYQRPKPGFKSTATLATEDLLRFTSFRNR